MLFYYFLRLTYKVLLYWVNDTSKTKAMLKKE